MVIKLCCQNQINHEIRDYSLSEVYRADEMFCTGTMGELAPVTEVDGRIIGNGLTGPLTKHMSNLFKQCVAKEAEAILD